MTDKPIGVIGDSLALGIAWELGYGTHNVGTEIQEPNCRAKVGAGGQVIAAWPVPQTPVLVVSMGSNPTIGLAGLLVKVCGKAAPGAEIIFVVPAKEPARSVVLDYAKRIGAPTIAFVAADVLGVHPASYAPLAKAVLAAIPGASKPAADRKLFFDAVRSTVFDGALSQPQVDGLNRILDYAERQRTPTSHLAYILATVRRETGDMQPVEEGAGIRDPAARAAHQQALRYYPWFGRGLVQCTWEANYRRYGCANNPDPPSKMLEWPKALEALFDGMARGVFTTKKLTDFISADGTRRDFLGARAVVNGNDHAAEIAANAERFLTALTACGYGNPFPETQPAAPAPAPAYPKPEGPDMTDTTLVPQRETQAPAVESGFLTITIDQEALATFLGQNLTAVENLIAAQAVAHGVPSFVVAGALSLVGHADLPHWLAKKAAEFNVEERLQAGISKGIGALTKMLPETA